MSYPRKLKDPAADLAELTALFNASAHATLPCKGGEEWHSEDLRLQRRAAALCQPCTLLQVCRAFALASGATEGVWGGTTPADRRRLRRKAA
jgi:hypothetical protein